MRPTPHQVVTKNFESRSALVDKLADMVDKQRGDSSKDDVKARLMGLSNKKLLRLYNVEQRVRERYGDRDGLVKHIIETRTQAGLTADDSFREKLDGFSKARLLDMTRQKHAPRQTKQTPEQRMAKKRGRKARARAQEKAGS